MEEIDFYTRLLNLSDLKVVKVELEKSKIILHCDLIKEGGQACHKCNQKTNAIHQYKTRKIRDLDISGRQVWLYLRVPQYHCTTCNTYFNFSLDWASPNKSYTKRQSKFIFDLCAKQPFSEVGAIVDMNAKTVENIYYHEARCLINLKERYKAVKKLGIDELAHRKGKGDYVCVLVDLEIGIELDVLPSRKKEVLIAHFKSIPGNFLQQIEVVCCDIWRPYIDTAEELFPNATIVLDRFHVVKSLNNALDVCRKKLRKEHKDKACFKNIKWSLFKRRDQCSKEEKELLDKAMNASDELAEMYELRNEFHKIMDEGQSVDLVVDQFDEWMEKVENAALNTFDSFKKTLQKWKLYIANFVTEGITNAATEGLNNYIRYFKRISFGMPNFENMRTRILVTSVI